ncbi:MAG: hypothetical protein ACREV7_15365 [Steroidobacteraceae bacterium]
MKKCSDPLIRATLRDAVRTVLRRSRPVSAFTSINTVLLSSMGALVQSPASLAATETSAPVLHEIVVTAQRRRETVQEIPYNISVIDSRQIAESGATTLNDLCLFSDLKRKSDYLLMLPSISPKT